MAVPALILLIIPDMAKTRPSSATIKRMKIIEFPKMNRVSASFPETYIATTAVRQSPMAIQLYTLLINSFTRVSALGLETDVCAMLLPPFMKFHIHEIELLT